MRLRPLIKHIIEIIEMFGVIFLLGLVIRRFSDEMEKVRIGMTDSTFFICREVEVRIRSE